MFDNMATKLQKKTEKAKDIEIFSLSLPTKTRNVMTVHIFNPEHDIALSSKVTNFTAPHAGRLLRYDLGWLPVIWAQKDDFILVDDEKKATHDLKYSDKSAFRFIDPYTINSIKNECIPLIDHIEPWGWDAPLRNELLRLGFPKEKLPTVEQIKEIKNLSHRRTVTRLLPFLRFDQTVGQAFECKAAEEVEEYLVHYGNVVLKAPWSSSGRGVRFVSSIEQLHHPSLSGWVRNVIARQGSLMLEPYYNKVKDFGMEFYSDGKGSVSYEGLSLFHADNGAYSSNLIATEPAKAEMLCRYLTTELLETVRTEICKRLAEEFCGKYEGPFGVDMMVVAGSDRHSPFLLHPCVEVNVRRTMGHVALSLFPRLNPTSDDDLVSIMRIDYTNNNYQLRIKRL